jgi:ABC-type glycerol-3-phosphate transport system permease component
VTVARAAVDAGRHGVARRQARRGDAGRHVFLLIILGLTYYPLLFTLMTSFKSNLEFVHHMFTPVWPLHPGNYLAAWQGVGHYVINTVVVAGASVAGTLVCGSLAAYAFARLRFPLMNYLFMAFVALLMIPSILTLIPLFLEIKSFHLLNSWWALILPYIAGGQALTVFVLRAFFRSLPEELFEAARIDGASEWQAFRHIALPLSGAIVGAMAIISALGVWGDYLWPTIVLQNANLYTISAGITNYVASFGTIEQVGPTFAAYVIASLPMVLLIVFTMRYYIAGMTSGALKL